MSTPITSLEPSALDTLFRAARTTSAFTDDPVPEEKVREIYDLMKFGPTCFNTQTLRVLLLRSPESRQRLVNHMIDNNQEKTTKAPLTAVLAGDLDFPEHLGHVYPIFPQLKDWFYSEPEPVEEEARYNAILAAGYFILAVRSVGLAAGPMAGFDPEGVNKEFFGDGRKKVVMVVNIGVPAGPPEFPRLPRLDYDQVVESI